MKHLHSQSKLQVNFAACAVISMHLFDILRRKWDAWSNWTIGLAMCIKSSGLLATNYFQLLFKPSVY